MPASSSTDSQPSIKAYRDGIKEATTELIQATKDLRDQVNKDIKDRIDDVMKVPIHLEVRDIFATPRRKVIDDSHAVAVTQESLCKMGTDETRAASNETVHLFLPPS